MEPKEVFALAVAQNSEILALFFCPYVPFYRCGPITNSYQPFHFHSDPTYSTSSRRGEGRKSTTTGREPQEQEKE